MRPSRPWQADTAGPAVIEVFGETPFLPESRRESLRLSPRQQQLMVKMNHQATQLTNQYIIGKERSFTIIAFPVPQIGDRFEEIFRDTVKINTLDNGGGRLFSRLLLMRWTRGTGCGSWEGRQPHGSDRGRCAGWMIPNGRPCLKTAWGCQYSGGRSLYLSQTEGDGGRAARFPGVPERAGVSGSGDKI